MMDTDQILSLEVNPMKNRQWMLVMVLLAAASLAISACSIAVDRNPDGSLKLEVDLPESTIQAEIEAALNDPLITDLQVDLRSGYIFVTADRKRVLGDETDMLSFRLDLGVSDGHLTAVISDAKINDEPVNDAYIEVWNQRLAQRLEEAARRNPDSTLQSVSVSDSALKFIWRIETPRSKGG
jgi:hypothetical protein